MAKTAPGPDGVLLIDKPPGPTSHDLVARVRRALGTRRVGHAGTLDPFASGLLVCCVGRATRLVRFLTASDKRYEAVARLGFATDTGDRTGEPLADPVAVELDDRAIAAAAEALTGEIDQVPPMYSAKKKDGKKLYQLAREGREVERDPVRVRVGDWELGALEGELLPFAVTVSSGTYIRVLAEELGRLSGCPAHLESLRRSCSGDFVVADAVAVGPGRDEGPEPEAARAALIPLDRVPLPLPDAVLADAEAVQAFAHGRAIPAGSWTGSAPECELAVRDGAGGLLGVASVGEGRELAPAVVLIEP